MKPIINIQSISDINNFVQHKTKHPLVTVIDFSKMDEIMEEGTRISCDFYSIMFKNYCTNNMRYGRQTYDFQEGSLVCIAPKQVVTMDGEIEKRDDMMGWGLFFHPDLLHGTSLGAKMKDYTFSLMKLLKRYICRTKKKIFYTTVFRKLKVNCTKILIITARL